MDSIDENVSLKRCLEAYGKSPSLSMKALMEWGLRDTPKGVVCL
jgi:hypothetical protein